jgi:hypothetical protein
MNLKTGFTLLDFTFELIEFTRNYQHAFERIHALAAQPYMSRFTSHVDA